MSLDFAFTADNRNFMNTLHEITSGVDNATRQIEASGNSIEGFIGNIKAGLATLGVATGLKEFASQVMSTRAEIQSLGISFETLLGDGDKAREMFGEIREFAVNTPMMLKDLATGAQTMLSFDIEEDKIMDYLKALGDISMGDAGKFNSLTLAFSQMSAAGKVMGQDLMQMIGAGFNPLNEIARTTGKTLNEVKEAQEAGRITVEQVTQAFISATSEGGKYYQMLEKQSHGLQGAISNLEGAVDDAFNAIGEKTEWLMSGTIDMTTSMVKNWEEVALAIGAVIGGYGLQKAYESFALVMANSASTVSTEAQYVALQKIIAIKVEEEKTDLEAAVAEGRLTQARAEEIAALRAEAKQVVANLELRAREAAQALSTAKIKDTAAKEELAVAGELLAAEEAKLAAAMASGDASAIAAAQREVAVAEEMKLTAATTAETAAKELNTVSTKANAISVQADAASKQLDAISTTGDIAATNLLTAAKNACTAAAQRLWATMMANPIMMVTAAAVALGYAIYKVCTYESDHEKAMRSANEAAVAQEASMCKEISTLDELKRKLESSKKGTDEWKSAKDAIISQYGRYLNGLDEEISKTGSLTSSYKELTKAIRMSAAARALQDYRETRESGEDYKKDFNEALENSEKSLSGTFLKRDGNGNLVKDKKGKYIQISLTDEEQRQLQALAYDYMTTGNFDGTDQQRAYMQAAGLLGGTRYGKKGSLDKVLDYNKETWEGEKKVAKKFGATVEEVDGVDLGDKEPKKKSSSQRTGDDIDKEIKEKKDELKKYKIGTEEWKKIDAEITSLQEERKGYGDYDRDHKNKTTKSSGPTAEQIEAKEENAQGKIADLLRKQAEERLRIEQDYEYERWQSRIDLMDDGEKKVIAQMKLDNSKERTELDRRKKSEEEAELQRQMALFNAREDALAASNKKYAKKTFRDSDIDESEFDKINERYEKLYTDLDASQKKAETDRLKSAKESMNVYLREFGSYQDKRVAIQEEYEKKILESQNDGERLQAIANRNKALADFDFNEWKENGGMSLAFGDIEKLSKQTITGLIADMEKYRSKIISTFDPDKIKIFEDTLNNLRMAEVSDSFFVNDDALSGLRERLAIQKQIVDEEANEAELKRQMADIEFQLAALNVSAPSINLGYTPDGENIESKSLMSDEDIRKADELRVMLDAASQALEKSTRNSSQLKSQLDNLGKVKFSDIQKFSSNLLKVGSNASDLASIFSDDLGDAIGSATDKMGTLFEAFTELSSNIESLAKAGKEAVKKTADASATIVEGASEGMKASASATSASLSTLEKASAILAIIGAAIQLATIVASLFDKDKKHEKNIKALQDQIDALERSYDRLGKAADEAFSTDASNLINQQNTLLQQQKVLIKQQMAEEEAKKKTDSDKIKQYKEQLEDIDDLLADNAKKAREAIIGEDLKSAINEFASLYADAWNDGTDAAQKSMAVVKNIISSALSELLKKNVQPAATKFYDYLADALKRGLTDSDLDILDAYKKQMDAAVSEYEEQWKKIQDRYKDLDELKEELTDISFDSVRDNFKSLLSDMESTTADFTNSFSDMLRNALLEGLMSEKYDLMLKEWYDEFADAMNDRTLTDSERDALRQQYDAIVQQGLSDRDLINSIVGGGAYSQEVTKGGWATMGQDQADELNGRFTALTELEAINNSLVGEGNIVATQILDTLRGLAALTMTTEGDDTALRDIRDMMFLSTGYLEDISKYTKQLITIRDGIERLNDMINERL